MKLARSLAVDSVKCALPPDLQLLKAQTFDQVRLPGFELSDPLMFKELVKNNEALCPPCAGFFVPMKIELLSFASAVTYIAVLAAAAVIVRSYPEGILRNRFKDESESTCAFQ